MYLKKFLRLTRSVNMKTGRSCRTLRRRHVRPRLLLERRHLRWDRWGIKIPVISLLSWTRFDKRMNNRKTAMRIEPFPITSLFGSSCQMRLTKITSINYALAVLYWSSTRSNDVRSTCVKLVQISFWLVTFTSWYLLHVRCTMNEGIARERIPFNHRRPGHQW